MNFLHPALAWSAVGAVALPIVIHLLFRRRRVPVDWAAMELLREAIRRTNRRLRLEQWIVLALRSLAVLAAGLALAVPFLGDGAVGPAQERTWMVVVDNGATSALRAGRGSELDRLRDEVRAMIEADRAQGDRYGIVTAAIPAQLVLGPTADVAEFERVLGRIEPAETPSDLPSAIDAATDAAGGSFAGAGSTDAERARAGRVLVASAFRRASLREGEVFGSAAPVGEPEAVEAADAVNAVSANGASQVEMIAVAPATDAPADVRIRRIETRAMPSGGTQVVRIELSREGAELDAATTRVRVAGEGWNAVAPREVRWEAGQPDAEVELQIAPSSSDAGDANARRQRLAVTVSLDDDALAVGNSAFAVIDLRREIEVAVVGRRGTLDGADIEKVPGSLWIARALAPGMGAGCGRGIRPRGLRSRVVRCARAARPRCGDRGPARSPLAAVDGGAGGVRAGGSSARARAGGRVDVADMGVGTPASARSVGADRPGGAHVGSSSPSARRTAALATARVDRAGASGALCAGRRGALGATGGCRRRRGDPRLRGWIAVRRGAGSAAAGRRPCRGRRGCRGCRRAQRLGVERRSGGRGIDRGIDIVVRASRSRRLHRVEPGARVDQPSGEAAHGAALPGSRAHGSRDLAWR